MFGHRRLRAREKRRYNEDAADEELEGKRNFNLDEQITAERFSLDKDKYLKQLTGETITLRYIQKNGFDKPILVKQAAGLNLRMPPGTFSIKDVKNCVGSKRTLDVMDVQTQKDIEMSMKEWCKYYESKHKDKLLNVISLEFSHTKLDQLVDSPMIVKLLDWVDLAWPRFLKQSQTESTNTINKMKYPKVQKYCLMSVKGSYTDFHIDFGGTSVWYHVLRGKKVFWMVPPTELNLTFYEEWILSGKQQDVFFGDTVEECFRIELEAGNTFFIPSGWIHAVYTPEDSLVFGGNFLHSYGIEKQLRVSQIEDATKVPIKFRYPFYTELLWYVLQHYVLCLTGIDHLMKQEELEEDEDQDSDDDKTEEEKEPQKRPAPNKKGRARRGKARRGKRNSQKKVDEDEDKTEVEETDTEEQEDEKTKINNVTTCRMTKNSLLRLQYEVTPTEKTNSEKITPSSPPSTSPPPPKEPQVATSSSPNETKELVSQVESKNNGWSLAPNWTNAVDTKEPKKVYLTKFEINGLKFLVKYLSKLTGSKKNLPYLIKDSKALIDDTKKMIADHENDDPDLAITGKPISHSLASNSTDMNQLIGQFFRIKDDFSSAEEEDGSDQVSSDNNPRGKKTSPEKKANNNSSPTLPVPTKSASATTTTDHSSSASSKFNSPTKKEKTVLPLSTSPPPKPPSPPTRPLSYNQYTAKTKNRNLNEPLPGSFASLIAATSTERNSFDLSVSEASTVPLSISLGPDSSSKSGWGKSSTSGSEGLSPSFRKNDAQTTPNKWASLMTSKVDSVKKAPSDKSVTPSNTKTPSSPVPPKIAQPKPPIRFVSLNQKPQNKEKLIFASTPYNSNAHGNQPRLQPNSIVNRPIYQQFGTPFSAPSSAMFSNQYPTSNPTNAQQHPNSPYPPPNPSNAQQHPNSPYPPPNPSNAQQHPNSPYPPPNPSNSQQHPNSPFPPTPSAPQQMHRMTHPPIPMPTPSVKQFSPIVSNPTTSTRRAESPNQETSSSLQEARKYQLNQKPSISSQNQQKLLTNHPKTVDIDPVTPESAQKHSQPTTPLNQSAPIKDPESSVKIDQHKAEPSELSETESSKNEMLQKKTIEVDQSASKQQQKPKVKRAKKNEVKQAKVEKSKSEKKDTKKPRNTAKSKKTESSTSKTTQPDAPKPNVPVTTQANIPMAANAFIMSRPMMNINGHTYPPQFQPINNQATMNVLTRAGLSNFISPFPQQIGLPTVHNLNGARFILATTPQARPNTTSTPNRPVAPVKNEPDNAALLSLATTALSAHPQTIYSHNLAPRPNVTQAILVRPPNSSTIYSGQHLFRPVAQPMLNTNMGPMLPKDVAHHPMALQTNLGSLVLARLPNQSGPRFLLASPMIQQAYQFQHRSPSAHQQVQPQAPPNQMSSGSSAITGINNTQAPKLVKQDGTTEPIYRQPPKKMARAMFVPTSAWNQLQNQHNASATATNNGNTNVSTGMSSTTIVSSNSTASSLGSNLTSMPMASTFNPSSNLKGETIAQNTPMNMNKSDMKNASKASKRPAKARHKRGGHRCQTRRMRCSKCPSCVRSDCGSCDTCKNMSKFGGPGTQKQACLARQCTNPQLPRNVVCEICNIDGFTATNGDSKNQSTLMECNTCYKIVHPHCFRKKRPDLASINAMIDTDFVNSWKCPGCVSGKSDSPEVVDTFDIQSS